MKSESAFGCDLAELLNRNAHLLRGAGFGGVRLPFYDEAPTAGLEHLFGRAKKSNTVFGVVKSDRDEYTVHSRIIYWEFVVSAFDHFNVP